MVDNDFIEVFNEVWINIFMKVLKFNCVWLFNIILVMMYFFMVMVVVFNEFVCDCFELKMCYELEEFFFDYFYKVIYLVIIIDFDLELVFGVFDYEDEEEEVLFV